MAHISGPQTAQRPPRPPNVVYCITIIIMHYDRNVKDAVSGKDQDIKIMAIEETEETTAPLTRPDGKSASVGAAATEQRGASAAARARADERRTALLTAPVLPTLLRLALPTMTVL